MTEVSSTGDDRTANNSVRHADRVLSDQEKEQLTAIKDLCTDFIAKLHEIGATYPAGERFGSGNLALSFRPVEDAVYRALKHITA